MTRRPDPATGPRARLHVIVFLAFVATIFIVGRSASTTQQRQFEIDLRERIDQIADLKANQVASWRTERLGETTQQLQAWLSAIRIQYQYEDIVLVDTSGRIRLAAGELLATPDRYSALASEALQTDRIVCRDVPRDASVRGRT